MVEKIGPYRVYERLGVGGMGEVYKAYDERLERWVAIKRIRPDREDLEDNRERFKREARATARLNHPSIVHLYGIFQEGDSDCIVMEYIEGESLDQKLVQGPMDCLQVATLGHEIASGLAEAHAVGILHRDLKAENIIITPRGRSKILDFGLAKPILSGELDPVLTGKGQLVGTSRAMSPEYVGGEAIDHRSDLFSLGVLLYECLTGQSPFKSHNTLATLKQVMLHKQTPIRELNADVPQELSKVVEELLEKEPDDRPQTAQDVALSLGTLSGQMSSGVLDRPPAALLDPTAARLQAGARNLQSSETMLDLRPRRRWMTGLAVLGGLLVVAFMLGRLFNQSPEVEPLPEGEQIRVVLGDFVNQTDEPVFDEALQQAMRVDLEQSKFVRTLSPSRVRETLERMQRSTEAEIDREVAVEIARREGTHRVILGGIQKFGTRYSLLVEVVAPENDVTTFSAAESARNHEGILSAMQDLTKAVRRHLGESADQITRSTLALEKVTTPNFEALRAYTLGEQRISRRQFDQAVPLLRRAIDLDESFGMAYAKLVVAYSNLGNTDRAIREALEAQRHSERLTERERFYVDGWVARWLGTPQDSIDVWSLFRDLHPEEFSGHNNLALSYWYYRNDFAAAAEAFESAARVAQAPLDEELARWCLGFCRLALGQLDSAEEALRTGGVSGIEGLVFLNSIRGDFDRARSDAERLEDPAVRARAIQQIQVSQGLLQQSLTTIREERVRRNNGDRAPRVDNEMHATLTELALVVALGAGGDLDGSTKRLRDLATRTDLYSRDPNERSAPMVAAAVKILAVSGHPDSAAELRQMMGEPKDHVQAIVRALIDVADAELALARGDHEAAKTYLGRSLDRVETITARESLGRVYELQGDLDAAIEEYRWVQMSPGLAYVECSLSCSSVSNTVILWTMSSFRLARLLEETGDLEAAAAAFSFFVDRWSDPQIPEVAIARRRLVALAS